MKQETGKIIRERLEKLNKYLQKTGGRFRAKSIHSFRLEVKKLRSFLKLFMVNESTVFIPKRLKKLYRLLGRIRLIQLHHKAILATAHKSHIGQPSHYLASLENQRCKLKKEAKNYIRTMKPLRAKNFGKGLPCKIPPEDSIKYFALQENGLDILLHRPDPDEESLHAARKILKGMLYDLPYLKDSDIRNREFNSVWAAGMKSLESKIGEFHDISTSLQILREALRKHYGIREKHYLTLILNQWQKDKEDLKRQITDMGLTLSDKNIRTA
jgi:CHAD domain-containing protein